jgi:predicted translin family RNA/ssDNA-binding protein
MSEQMINLSKNAETSIDFVESESNDVAISIDVSVQGTSVMSNTHDLSFDEAKAFLKELDDQLESIRSDNL